MLLEYRYPIFLSKQGLTPPNSFLIVVGGLFQLLRLPVVLRLRVDTDRFVLLAKF